VLVGIISLSDDECHDGVAKGETMAQDTSTAVKSAARGRLGMSVSGAGLAVLVLTLGYWLFATVTGGVTLTNAQLKTTLTGILIATSVGGLIGLIALGVNLFSKNQAGRLAGAVIGGLTVALAIVFMIVMVMPHVQLATFAQSMQDKCQTPLDNIKNDITAASAAAKKDVNSDSAFEADMVKYAGIFQQDSSAANDDINSVQALTPPQNKYQAVITDCAAQFQADAHFLTGSDGVTLPSNLPPPFGGLKISAHDLLQDSSLLVQGKLPNVNQTVPTGQVSPLVSGVLDAALKTCDDLCTRLTNEGNQLKSDAFSPFKAK
jgi:hypothetical protein